MSRPAISVAIPTRDRRQSLARCLDALARVREPDGGFEVVVAADGPDAGAEAAVAARPANFRFVAGHGGGPASARNAAAEAATGGLIVFTDDDCEPTPGWLCALARAHSAQPAAALGGRTLNGVPRNPCSETSQAVTDAFCAHSNSGPEGPRFFPSNNLAFPAAGFATLGGFDTGFRGAAGEDRDLCARWTAAGGSIVEVSDAVVRHMREMSIAGLWRQQRGYGRGSRQVQRRLRPPDRPGAEPGFHRALAERIGRVERAGRGSVATLVVMTQVAVATGYLRG